MADSSYYQSQMNAAAQQKRRLQDKKSEYMAYKEKLQNLKSSITPAVDEMNNASKTFLKGGYVDEGKGLDRGKLKENANKLEDAIGNLSSLISKTQSEIDSIQRSINQAQNSYNTAQSAYNRAKANEAAANKA